jgi:FkbM family methyltransferase
MQHSLFYGEIQDGKHIDNVLRDYFPDYNYKGVFFDVGAFEPITISNSYHFEKNGWDCYCFEANTQGIPLLKQHRKNVFNYAIANEDKGSTIFNVVLMSHTPNWTASYSAINLDEDYKRIFGFHPESVTQICVPQRTLNTVITNEIPDLQQIDIMSLDIEGGEMNCLYGFDLKKYNPYVIVLENVTNDTKIQKYLEKFEYNLDKHISYNQYYVSNRYHTFINK